MYFSDNSGLHEVEKMMCKIPNFRPIGHGSRVLRKDMEECIKRQPPPDSYEQMIKVTMAAIHYPPFAGRVNQYMKERKKNAMNH